MRTLLLLLLCLLAVRPVSAEASPASDIVTLRNGDLHHGTLAVESFDLETPYGEVSVPFSRLAELRAVGKGGQVRLVTVEGESFTGHLKRDRVTILRLIEVPLVLHTDDLLEVSFARRRTLPRLEPSPDAVEMQNGDRFRVHVVTSDFMVMGDTGLKLMPTAQVRLVDTEPGPAGVRVRMEADDGDTVSGTLPMDALQVVLRHGQALSLPSRELAGLAVRVLPPEPSLSRPLTFAYRRKVDPGALVRDRFPDGTFAPEMVRLPAGRFMRGDADGDFDEKPPGEVAIASPFAIGLYEVTFEDYDRFCAATSCTPPDDEGWGRGTRPVINVSWAEAVAYARWLSAETGALYRLPTDAEWEYAARAGTTTRFWWGDAVDTARANCAECGSLWGGERTARVGRFPPNPFGLHDTAGNVFEWVADCWNDTFAVAPADGSVLDKPGCGKRVIRGGAWSFPPHEVRSANRWRDFPSRRSDDTGFRLVRELGS